MEQKETLEQIFYDANVIDVDFSNWNRWVRIVVVAESVPDGGDEDRSAVFTVEFERVADFRIEFRHHERMEKFQPPVYQWRINAVKISDEPGETKVRLFNEDPDAGFPIIEVAFASFDVRKIAARDLNEVLPGWSDPFQELARPGIEEMLTFEDS